MTALHDAIVALCAAVDAGDDSALTILADALEEAGDQRAEDVRLVAEWADPSRVPYPCAPEKVQQSWGWARQDVRLPHRSCVLASAYFDSLDNGMISAEIEHNVPSAAYLTREWALYPTRSAAYLALAKAIRHS